MSEPEPASLIEREKSHMAKADEDLKAHEAAVEKAKAEGDSGAPAAEAKPAAKTTAKATGDSA